MLNKSLKEIFKSLLKKEFSVEDLVKFFLNRISKFNNTLNCFITILEEEAILKAKKIDKDFKKNINKNIMSFIPFAHKDVFCTKNILTTCASKMLSNYISPYDSTINRLFKKRKFILLGKTNMDEFSMGISNETSYYGKTLNPWNINKVSGGSSGGSAAAVSARLVPFATGSDTGGSIRIPSSFCGITGIKPSYGRVSRYGMISYASSLEQAGIMAKSAEDCSYILEIISGFDKMDSTSSRVDVPKYSKLLNKSINNLKILIPKEFMKNIDSNLLTIFENLIHQFIRLGVKIEYIDLYDPKLFIAVYYTLALAECSSNLSKYDGIRYGFLTDKLGKSIDEIYFESRSNGFGDEVKNRIILGSYILSSKHYDSFYLKAQKIRSQIYNYYISSLNETNVIMTLTSPSTAFGFNENISDLNMYLLDLYTCGANLAGLPAISFPCGFLNNLPVGAQLIAAPYKEEILLNVVNEYQKITNWHNFMPKGIELV